MAGVAFHSVGPGEADIRLDRWFGRNYPGLTHGRLEKLLRTGQIRVDGRRARSGTRLSPGQTVRVPPLDDAAARPDGPRGRVVSPSDRAWIRALVIHSDDDVIVLNKPPGIAVQGGSGVDTHIDGMLAALAGDGVGAPRLVHRLDRDTGGVLVVARHAAAAAALAAAFRRRDVHKTYWALVAGVPRQRSGVVDSALAKTVGRDGRERVMAGAAGGRQAVTRYRVVEAAGRRAAWLALHPLTGRTHQLRVHCAGLGTPIIGDRKYGDAADLVAGLPAGRSLHLHARAIEIAHPSGGTLRAEAPLSAPMAETWRFLGFDPNAERS